MPKKDLYTVYLHCFDFRKGPFLLQDPVKGTLAQCMMAAALWAEQDNIWLFGAIVGKGKELYRETAIASIGKRHAHRDEYTYEVAMRVLKEHPRPAKTEHSAVEQYNEYGRAK